MVETLDGVLGAMLKRERIRRGLSQAQVARLSGLSRRHLATIERGANVSVALIVKVAQVLELDTVELGGGIRGKVQPFATARVDRALEKIADAQVILEDAKAVLAEPR